MDGTTTKIRAVTFDLDDTLWQAEEVLERAESVFYDYIESECPKIAEKYSRALFWQEMLQVREEYPAHGHDYTFLRKQATLQCAMACGVNPDEIVDKAFDIFITERSRPVLFPPVLETLRALQARGFILGAITNGNFKIELMPELQSIFQFCVSAEQVGAAKPHAAPFIRALDHIQLSADNVIRKDQIVHIGDDYKCDIQGAKAFGMKTIWVRHHREMVQHTNICNPDADATVSCVSNVPSIIDIWTGLQNTRISID